MCLEISMRILKESIKYIILTVPLLIYKSTTVDFLFQQSQLMFMIHINRKTST